MQAVASATEELTYSSREISGQMEKSSYMAQQAVDETTCTNTTVDQLALAAQKIGDVVQLIQQIAGQTNFGPRTRPSKRHAPVMPARALPWSPVKSSSWPIKPHAPPKKSPPRSPAFRAQPRKPFWRFKIAETIGQINVISSTIENAVQEQTAAIDEISHAMSSRLHTEQEKYPPAFRK